MRILYLEDSDSDIDLMRRYIKAFTRSELVVVKTEATAVAQLNTHRPDVFLVDVMIDGVPVHNLIQTVLAQKLANHVVLVTAKALPSELEFYRSLGCRHVIAKPFTADDLDHAFAQIA